VAGLARQFVGIAAYMDLAALNRLAAAGSRLGRLPDDRPAAGRSSDARAPAAPRVAAIVSQTRAMAAFQESYDRSVLTMTFILSLFAG